MNLFEAKDQKQLGIYLCKNSATVLCPEMPQKSPGISESFSVAVEPQDEQNLQQLISLIAENLAAKGLVFSNVTVALDSAMFIQHNVHSEFTDQKQIMQTIRFDTEEAAAMDISDLAAAFRAISAGKAGSELSVFTARKKLLSEILLCLQNNGLDPVSIEPDVSCLSRFIQRNVILPQDSNAFFYLLSQHSGYFIAFSESQKILALRTFLLSDAQNRTELLRREISIANALIGAGETANAVNVFDSTGSVNYQQLGESLGTEVVPVDILKAASVETATLTEAIDPVNYAIACGAVLDGPEKNNTVNFRNDFMPYQGIKRRMEKAIKILSVSVTIFMLTVGVYFQVQLLQENKYRGRLRKKFAKDYSAAMFGKEPSFKSDPARKLAGELRRIRDVKSGQLSITGQESASAKLTLILEAFNKIAASTELNIDTINIGAKSISISGDTSSRKNTLRLFDAIKSNRLNIVQQRLDFEGRQGQFQYLCGAEKINQENRHEGYL